MSEFDPLQKRETLLDWAIASELSMKMETFESDAAIGSSARAMLGNAIYGWIVGLRAEVQPVLQKSREWLEISRARNEEIGEPPAYFAMLREVALELAIWMLEGRSDREAYGRILDLHEESWTEIESERGFPASEALEHYIGPYLRDCLQARAWDRGAAAYESFGGRAVTNAADLNNGAEFGYWACRRRLPQPGMAEDYIRAAERVFGNGTMEEWLGRGHHLTAATWLKTLYWESGSVRGPEEALLKAYDLMPGVKRPPVPGRCP
jgi:hypothetical protein